MDFLTEGFREASRLVFGGDPDTWHAIGLSLWTSSLAVALGLLVGLPVGAWLAIRRPRGSRALVFGFRLGMAVPTVVIGLLVYGLLSRRGELGSLDWLYTPTAIVIGETLLAIPILVSLSHAAFAALDPVALETVRTHGGGPAALLAVGVSEMRSGVVAAVLMAFGRCSTELGIALMVGGGIKGRTRTLPMQSVLEINMGEFGKALAAGIVLLLLALVVAAFAHVVGREGKR